MDDVSREPPLRRVASTNLAKEFRLCSAVLLRRLVRGDFARHGLLVFASSMLVNIFNFVFHFTISRRLGVAEYGDLYALFSTLSGERSRARDVTQRTKVR